MSRWHVHLLSTVCYHGNTCKCKINVQEVSRMSSAMSGHQHTGNNQIRQIDLVSAAALLKAKLFFSSQQPAYAARCFKQAKVTRSFFSHMKVVSLTELWETIKKQRSCEIHFHSRTTGDDKFVSQRFWSQQIKDGFVHLNKVSDCVVPQNNPIRPKFKNRNIGLSSYFVPLRVSLCVFRHFGDSLLLQV